LATHILQRGGIVAYPTESVFGLGCNPLNEAAVMRLLALKRRDSSKGLILIAHSFDQLREYTRPIPPDRLTEVQSHWPGPSTWLLPAAPWVPAWLTGRHSTLAMRVTAHPLASALCLQAGMPLVSTSANLSGRPPARSPLQVRLRCGNKFDLLLHGSTSGLAQPTPIRDALTGARLR
jgi:L-threonylcarbamoyladenylate synthase